MITILDLIRECGLQPRKASGNKGGEYHCACPGCGDGGKGRHSDRFHAWPAQNDGQGSYWCRQCGSGGDVIQFMIDFQNMSFKNAAARAGKTLDSREIQPMSTPRLPFDSATPHQVDPESSSIQSPDLWQRKAARLVDWAHDQLKKDHEQLKYLAGRGLTIKAVERFRLGWNPGERGRDIFRSRESWGLGPETSPETGKPKKLWIPRGLVIPLIDETGRVDRVRVRRPEGEPRYYVLPGGPSDPIPLLAVPSTWPGMHQALIVCEAELDGMLIAMSAGDLTGVLALGSASAKPRHERANLLAGEAAWIGLAMDRDQAGDEAMKWWLESFDNVQDIRPQGVKDPGELVLVGQDVRAWVESSLPRAWRSGRVAKMKGIIKEGQGFRPNRVTVKKDGLPRTVREMGLLLKKFPAVRVEVRPDRWAMWAEDSQGREVAFWDKQDPAAGRRLHDLYWYDPDVERWLLDRAPGIFDGYNFLRGK